MNEWETFFAWTPIRIGRKTAWLRKMQRAKAYFVALNDDSGNYGPKWVYRYPVKERRT